MAHEGEVLSISRKSAADLSSSQYYAVRLDETSGQIKLANATSMVQGILTNKPVTNRAGRIVIFGECPAYCSGTVTVMDRLAPNDSGVLVVTTADNDEFIAIALEAHASDTPAVRTVQVTGPFRR